MTWASFPRERREANGLGIMLPGEFRTMEFQDADRSGVDDRDEYYVARAVTPRQPSAEAQVQAITSLLGPVGTVANLLRTIRADDVQPNVHKAPVDIPKLDTPVLVRDTVETREPDKLPTVPADKAVALAMNKGELPTWVLPAAIGAAILAVILSD